MPTWIFSCIFSFVCPFFPFTVCLSQTTLSFQLLKDLRISSSNMAMLANYVHFMEFSIFTWNAWTVSNRRRTDLTLQDNNLKLSRWRTESRSRWLFKRPLIDLERVWRMTLSPQPFKYIKQKFVKLNGVWFFDVGRAPLAIMISERFF